MRKMTYVVAICGEVEMTTQEGLIGNEVQESLNRVKEELQANEFRVKSLRWMSIKPATAAGKE